MAKKPRYFIVQSNALIYHDKGKIKEVNCLMSLFCNEGGERSSDEMAWILLFYFWMRSVLWQMGCHPWNLLSLSKLKIPFSKIYFLKTGKKFFSLKTCCFTKYSLMLMEREHQRNRMIINWCKDTQDVLYP